MTVHRTLYHWTHRSNLASIAQHGLSPDWCQGRKKCVWACTVRRVGWALGHVAARHGHDPDEMILLTVRADSERIRRTKFPGVLTCTLGYSPEQITSVRRGPLGEDRPLPAARSRHA